ncbi:hypothetical protein PRIPAC_84091 [Pristionchus pacificus]|uniref:Uncharacterized protein n=1 Tax=Pristionchus pacificus TaxID=54126 RepID=A0A2A6BTA0_PRIPA|nr:hypothetical protein PRIPAC_84091 [Pristionchus pacificus]|eukprot:PDM69087.1 hypothetical protein PRIPAC_47389 [Pristionchus pacificus]
MTFVKEKAGHFREKSAQPAPLPNIVPLSDVRTCKRARITTECRAGFIRAAHARRTKRKSRECDPSVRLRILPFIIELFCGALCPLLTPIYITAMLSFSKSESIRPSNAEIFAANRPIWERQMCKFKAFASS